MIIKCKMCGGDIDFTPGATYGTCAYCGSVSTIPRAEDEGKLNLYNRANHFRRQGEFDKALAAYEKLLELDDTDAEAHWGTAISRYGIEYVEDPASGQRIPTCHRVQVASILADADYLAAVEHAPDEESKRIYQAEAQRIAEIQKGILAISANEQPYDVFICYKETDDNGQRTHDSQWAQDVYYGLTELGYKVFFSRITLEDKLGQQYEPYIFAALNSAKVMVVIGSKPEYFNAVWVKNEWSRYLALMAKDRKRLLIPCYRGMDPYDLPEELSVLQSQDMGKIGFMQDLLRGVKKILDADKKAEQPKAVQQVMQTVPATIAASPGVSSLMDRTYLFMEDADFDSAADYLNRVLDIDPKFAPAYAAKVCVAFRIRKEPGLADTTFLYEDNADWQKAIRFANAQQKAIYEGYIAKVRERVAVQIRNYAYDCAVEMAVNPKADRNQLDNELSAYKTSCNRSNGNRADGNRRQNSQLYENAFKQAVRTNEPGAMSEQGLKTAAAMFDALKDSEAAECAKQCRAMAEQVIYTNAVTAYSSSRNNPTGLEQAAAVFLSVPQYKDAKAQAQKCLDEAEAIRDDLYNKAVSAMKEAGEESNKWEIARKKLSAQELNDYRDVAQLFVQAAKRYSECLAVEQEARRQQEEIARRETEAATARMKRDTILGVLATLIIIAAFIVVAKIIVPGNKYKKAEELRAAGRYAEAVDAFSELGSYSDAAVQVGATYYAEGEAKRMSGDWSGAEKAFANAGTYQDATTQISETKYQHARALAAKKDYRGAAAIFISINGYKDVDSLLTSDQNLSAAAHEEVVVAPYKKVGSCVTFGQYEQDNDTSNGKEDIEWLVLNVQDDKALLISRYGLDVQPYNEEWFDTTWEKCTLRTWLNGTFLNTAFTADEQKGILTTAVDNSKNQGYSGYSTYGGNNSKDKIFLLSYTEANQYFGITYDNGNNTKSRIPPTAYAVEQGAFPSFLNKTSEGTAAGWWWLRSPGYNQNRAAIVNNNGSLFDYSVDNGDGCIRPAFWLDLTSDIF